MNVIFLREFVKSFDAYPNTGRGVVSWVADVDVSQLKTAQDMANCWYEVFAKSSEHQSPANFIAQYKNIFGECEEQAA